MNYLGYEVRQIGIDTWSIWIGSKHIGNTVSKSKAQQIINLLSEWGDLGNGRIEENS